jgi:serine phosphatase RsbU (regulator of sigma subunit)
MFATIFFGLLKPSTGEFHYVNAGHNAPVIISANAAIRELPRTGLAVGLTDECSFERKTITIQKGEMLFAYTDGVTEAKTPSGDFFTRKRLMHLLEKECSSAAEKVAYVKFALDAHNSGAPPFDDITMLALRRK